MGEFRAHMAVTTDCNTYLLVLIESKRACSIGGEAAPRAKFRQRRKKLDLRKTHAGGADIQI